MTSIISTFIQYIIYIFEEIADPRTKDWFLIGPSWINLTILLLYLAFVYKIGPAFMERRPPYRIKNLLAIYNTGQILINTYIAYAGFKYAWYGKYKLICEPVDFSSKGIQIANVCWLYHLIKVIDLIDTVFYILQKKYYKITFLHVYHHGGMIICSWIAVRYLPGGHGTFLGIINAIVHIVMYTHYLWTTLNLSKPWWKKYLTQLQIAQFVTIFVHFAIGAMTRDCAFPRWTLAVFLPQNLFMTLLFLDFYYKTYVKKRPENIDQNDVIKTTESKQNGIELLNGKSKKC